MCSSSHRLTVPQTQPLLCCNRAVLPKTRISVRAAAVRDGSVAENRAPVANFYDLLGISESGSLGEIKQAYKQQVRKYHPDVSPPGRVEEYTERFIMVQEAYETLTDTMRRAAYDRDIASGLHLAFSARRRYNGDEEMEDRNKWKNRWRCQLSELEKRSTYKNSQGSTSWAAQMREQKKYHPQD